MKTLLHKIQLSFTSTRHICHCHLVIFTILRSMPCMPAKTTIGYQWVHDPRWKKAAFLPQALKVCTDWIEWYGMRVFYSQTGDTVNFTHVQMIKLTKRVCQLRFWTLRHFSTFRIGLLQIGLNVVLIQINAMLMQVLTPIKGVQ